MDSQDMTITYNAIRDRAMETAREYMPDLPKLPESQLYADSARGIYIPQYFAESVNREMCDASDDDLDQLAQGPDSCDHYWDIWTDVLDNTVLTDSDGQQWRLHQDGDLWFVPVDAFEAWESFQSDVESIDAHDIAHESFDWDWVIYYHRAMELCQAVPIGILHQAESDFEDMSGFENMETPGLYELAVQLAAIIVTREIVEAVETVKDELIDLAETQMESL